MVVGYFYFGLVQVEKEGTDAKVIIIDNFSSKRTQFVLHSSQDVSICSATDELIFLFTGGRTVFAYDLRHEKLFSISLSLYLEEWQDCTDVHIERKSIENELEKILDDQFLRWDNFRLPQSQRSRACHEVPEAPSNVLLAGSAGIGDQQEIAELMACTLFACYVVVPEGTNKSSIIKLYDSRAPEPRKLSVLQQDCLILKICTGRDHILLLDSEGIVYTYGSGIHGELGHGTIESTSSPRPIEMLRSEGIHVVEIAAGSWHSMLLTSAGDVYGFGWNNEGQLGYPTAQFSIMPSPFPLDLAFNARKIFCGRKSSCIHLENGENVSFGET